MFAALFGDVVGYGRAGGGPTRGGLRVHVDHVYECRRSRGGRFFEEIIKNMNTRTVQNRDEYEKPTRARGRAGGIGRHDMWQREEVGIRLPVTRQIACDEPFLEYFVVAISYIILCAVYFYRNES